MIRHVPATAYLLATLVVLAPLPFGGVLAPYSTWLFCACLAVLLVQWFANPGTLETSGGSDPRSARLPSRHVAPVLALFAIGAFGCLQSLDWPRSIGRLLAPGLIDLADRRSTLLAIDGSGSQPLSLAPAASREAAFDWFLPAAALLATLWVARSLRARRILLGGVLAAAGVQLAIGVQLWITRSRSLWGVEIHGTGERLNGSFVNPNHVALFLEIALAASFAWTWWNVRRSLRDPESVESRLLRIGPPALVFLLVFSGLLLTGSRAGAFAAIAALAIQGYLVGRRRGRTWIAAGGALAALAAIAFALLSGIEGSLHRMMSTPLAGLGGGGRVQATLATLDLWTVSPVTGVGLGAFRASFPLVQPETLPGVWRHAHSDWAELLATTGIVGCAIFATGLYFVLRRLARVISSGERSEDRAAGIAAAGALTAVAIHSFFDFGLTMPANAVLLAVVAGAGLAARTAPASTTPK